MSDIQFHQTRMGQRFYEATMPAIAQELARLNASLERLLSVIERSTDAKEGEARTDASAEEQR